MARIPLHRKNLMDDSSPIWTCPAFYGRRSEISIFGRLQPIEASIGPPRDLRVAERADLLVIANPVETDLTLKFQG